MLARDSRPKGSPIIFIVDAGADFREGSNHLIESAGLRSRTSSAATEFLQSTLREKNELPVRLPGPGGLDFQGELTPGKDQHS